MRFSTASKYVYLKLALISFSALALGTSLLLGSYVVDGSGMKVSLIMIGSLVIIVSVLLILARSTFNPYQTDISINGSILVIPGLFASKREFDLNSISFANELSSISTGRYLIFDVENQSTAFLEEAAFDKRADYDVLRNTIESYVPVTTDSYKTPPFSLAVALTLLFGLLLTETGQLDLRNVMLSDDDPYRLITYAGFHLNFLHFFGNCVLILLIGFVWEQHLTSTWFSVTFIISVIFGGMLSLAVSPTLNVVGASAGVYGLIGLAVTFPLLSKERLSNFLQRSPILTVLLFCGCFFEYFLFNVLDLNVANFVHLGGLTTGIVFGAALALSRNASGLAKS